MSRIATPSTAQPAAPFKVPQEKIAARAYEKWCQKGRPVNSHLQDWYEAERELQAEYARTGSNTIRR